MINQECSHSQHANSNVQQKCTIDWIGVGPFTTQGLHLYQAIHIEQSLRMEIEYDANLKCAYHIILVDDGEKTVIRMLSAARVNVLSRGIDCTFNFSIWQHLADLKFNGATQQLPIRTLSLLAFSGGYPMTLMIQKESLTVWWKAIVQ